MFVADEDRVGADGDGWRMAMTVLSNERGTVEAVTRYVEIRADMTLLADCCARPGEAVDQLQDLDIRGELVRWQVSKALARQEDEASLLRSAAVLKVLWSEL